MFKIRSHRSCEQISQIETTYLWSKICLKFNFAIGHSFHAAQLYSMKIRKWCIASKHQNGNQFYVCF